MADDMADQFFQGVSHRAKDKSDLQLQSKIDEKDIELNVLKKRVSQLEKQLEAIKSDDAPKGLDSAEVEARIAEALNIQRTKLQQAEQANIKKLQD